jgi:hypothetical protein
MDIDPRVRVKSSARSITPTASTGAVVHNLGDERGDDPSPTLIAE